MTKALRHNEGQLHIDPFNLIVVVTCICRDIFFRWNAAYLFQMKFKDIYLYEWAVVVVKWSACSPFTPTIWVQIPL